MEHKIRIVGGKPLSGEVYISGGKNPACAVLPAALLSEDVSIIDNLPDIEDVRVMHQMFEALGAKVERTGGTMVIDPKGLNCWCPPRELAGKMRASNYLMGVLLGRFGKSVVPLPGGCNIGMRPMDLHIKGLKALGATLELKDDCFYCSAEKLEGKEIYLDFPSVGATVNIMLAAARAEGVTEIVNAAREPHIVDLANMLSAMGARVKGAGTSNIRITGCKHLKGVRYSILPDQIETGTWMAIAAATGGDIKINGCIPYHMESVSAKLLEMNVEVEEGEDFIRVIGRRPMKQVSIKTQPYPGFPTDLQQPFMVLACLAEGTSVIIENVFEARFRHADELRKMGANIQVNNRVAVIEGVKGLKGAEISATDLRASAALVTAGLCAEGETVISNAQYIERGYENLIEKVRALGGEIEYI